MMFKNMKLSAKLTCGFGVVLIMMGLLVGFICLRIERIHELSQNVVDGDHLQAEILQRITDHVTWVSKVKDLFVDKRVTTINVETDDHKCALGRWLNGQEAKHIASKYPELARLMEEINAPHHRLHASAIKIDKLYSSNIKAAKAIMQNETLPAAEQTIAILKKILNRHMEKTNATQEQMVHTIHQTILWVIIASVITLIAGILAAFFITRSTVKPINKIVEDMSGGASQVAVAAEQVSSASQQLAEGAAEQAAGLEETSSAIEEMASMTKQNADNANQANSLTSETLQVVEQANAAMIELTGSMEDISNASDETAKIVKTIDEIAFQTNLLALNAAVEAARAGEAGAGFAVVADEVRNLAMRAADAAKNTADLIEDTVKKIKGGSDVVSRTNEAFARVAEGAKKIGELVSEISAASNEQAQGIAQVNNAVAGMDKITQQNASSAEESASAAEELTAQAKQMKEIVDELMTIVIGGKGKGSVRVRPSGAEAFQTRKKEAITLPTKRNTEKKEVDPEEIIPMDSGPEDNEPTPWREDENFKDF